MANEKAYLMNEELKSKFHPDHWADLEKSGLSEETVIESGIHTVPPNMINNKLGFNTTGITSAYQIPYPQTNLYRYKLYYDENFKEEKPKYRQPSGSDNRLFIPNKARLILQDTSIPIYFTEGEKKSLKVCQEGLPCIGLSGLWNWKNKDEDIIADFDLINFQERMVYIIPDSDYKSLNKHGYKKNLIQAVNRLCQKLTERGARVFIVQLPDGEL